MNERLFIINININYTIKDLNEEIKIKKECNNKKRNSRKKK